MKMFITGDLVINNNYSAIDNIDENLVSLFSKADFNITNIEAPVTDCINKIIKSGPHLKSDKISTLGVLKRLNVNIAALANNHINDFGEQGVIDTINFCESSCIETVGAGDDITKASETLVLDTEEGKIALINIAENEWASADIESAGANGMNLIKDIRQIQQARNEYDYVFVIVHGGHEYYNLPSPRMQELYRFYAEQGADLVVGHHTHCISGNEVYNGTPIYYSLGNFLFTKKSIYEDWYTGLVLEVNLQDKELSVKLHPVRQSKETFSLSLLVDKDKELILQRVKELSDVIINEKRFIKSWEEYLELKKLIYLNYWSPISFIKSRYLVGFLRRLKVRLWNRKGHTLYLNLMRCEAHHDISKEIIKKENRYNKKL